MTPIVREYLNHSRPLLWPIYISLAGFTVWLSSLTLLFFESEGVPAETLDTLGDLSLLLMLLFVAIPFGTPLIGMAVRRWR